MQGWRIRSYYLLHIVENHRRTRFSLALAENEDAHSAFLNPDDDSGEGDHDPNSFFAVFDGHGGE